MTTQRSCIRATDRSSPDGRPVVLRRRIPERLPVDLGDDDAVIPAVDEAIEPVAVAVDLLVGLRGGAVLDEQPVQLAHV